ncbi:MAG: hypothetical protein JWQ39_1385 [Glaciihabitans sp.]|nr:hypothetical protein [Glaciihabitans sp.]
MTDITAAEKAPRAAVRYGWASITAAIVFGVLYAYVLWDAIGNLVQLPKALDEIGVPWGLLILDVTLPVITYATAFWLGRRRVLANRVLFFLIGLTVLACCTVGSIAYVQHN